MDKVYDVIKSLIGIMLIFSFVMELSSCEKKQTNEKKEKDTFVSEEKKDTTNKTTLFSEESREIEVKLDSLKAKAEKKSLKAKKEINEAIDNLNAERKEILSDSTSDKLKETWNDFKFKAKKVIDSLERKF